MKISRSQMFRNFRNWCFSALTIVLATGSFTTYAQGDALFKAKCASCHQPHKNGTGPKLFQVRQKWSDGGAKEGSIYQWVNNWQTAAANDPYAQGVSTWSPTAMSAFPDLKKEEIDAIMDWVDSQPDPAAGGAADAGAMGADGAPVEGEGATEESSSGWIWIILSVIFITIILAVGGVRRQLKFAAADAEGEPVNEGLSYAEELKAWAWKYRLYVGLGSLVVVIGVVVTLFLGLYSIGVVENYQPSQPIAYPHAIHAGTNGIDCKYCHSSVTKSKSAGIPSVNVCMNCHKQINGRTPAQQEQIAKIYDAAGWNPEGAGSYTGKTKPIVWNKVHVLPDHVYFNHSQHVVVGGVDCKQCHGDMTKQVENQKVWPVEELNKIEGNIPLTKPTMTMGWCIECHDKKEISTGSIDTKNNGYYNEIHKRLLNNDKNLYKKYLDDGIVSVAELGGWECAKCHY
ncbi:MAG: c-type cytochrome [Crocinitomicaceae bacterium]|nr:c-type cytochrome [Crocinitomicaceae bacterium]